ncbi:MULTISPECIES: hypothetical protein [unclassified Bradyrhizobium]
MNIFRKRAAFASPKDNFRCAYGCVRFFGIHARRSALARVISATAAEKLERAIGEKMWAAASTAKTARDDAAAGLRTGYVLALQQNRRYDAEDEKLYRETKDERLRARLLRNQLNKLLHPPSRHINPLAY